MNLICIIYINIYNLLSHSVELKYTTLHRKSTFTFIMVEKFSFLRYGFPNWLLILEYKVNVLFLYVPKVINIGNMLPYCFS